MAQPVVYLDTSEVRAGRLEELKTAMDDLARFVQANEPLLLASTCTSATTAHE